MPKHFSINFVGFAALSMAAYVGCSAPQAKDAPAASGYSKSNDKTPITVDTSSGCIPSDANNHCQPTTSLGAVQKCWVSFLDTAEAKKCASDGKVWNRIQEKCTSMKLNSSNCTEAAVIAAFQAANFADPAKMLETAKSNIKGNSNSDVTLDQCGEVTISEKTVLIPIFISKKYEGGDDGYGTYRTFAGKVCGSTIPGCNDTLLQFTGSSTPATRPCD
jgi:hypothetical protein